MKHNTLNDALTALTNSGVNEWFDINDLDDAAEWMYTNDATPEQAAKHFNVD